MDRISEVRKQRVKVSLEIGEFANRSEGFADAAPPPFALEAPQLVRPEPRAEGQSGSSTESVAKAGGDGILGRVEAKIPREPGVGATDRLARLEQRPGSVEEYSADQEIADSGPSPVISRERLGEGSVVQAQYRTCGPSRNFVFHRQRGWLIAVRIAARPPENVAHRAARCEINPGRFGRSRRCRAVGGLVVGGHRAKESIRSLQAVPDLDQHAKS